MPTIGLLATLLYHHRWAAHQETDASHPWSQGNFRSDDVLSDREHGSGVKLATAPGSRDKIYVPKSGSFQFRELITLHKFSGER